MPPRPIRSRRSRRCGPGSARRWWSTCAGAAEDFLAVATPGAGKTTFALRIAAELLADGTVDAVTVVAPTEHLKTQWARGRGAGRHPARRRVPQRRRALLGRLPRRRGHLRPGRHGAAGAPPAHDDPAHAGDPRRDPPRRRLAVLGRRGQGRVRAGRAPADADRHAVPLRRQPDPVRRRTSAAATGCCGPGPTRVYGYADALRDGVVRPVIFLAYSGETRWRTTRRRRAGRPPRRADDPGPDRPGLAHRAGPDRRLDAAGAAGRRRPAAGQAGRRHARRRRPGDRQRPDSTARAYARLLERITGEKAVVVLSDDAGASARIADVRRRRRSAGWSRCGWCPRASTSRGWPSGCTRPARRRRCTSPRRSAGSCGPAGPARRPRVFLPSVPHLLGLASEMEAQRDHVLGAPKEPGRPRRRRCWSGRSRPRTPAASWTKRFEALSATAELDQVIFDGASFGTAARSPARPRRRSTWACPGCSPPTRCRRCSPSARPTSWRRRRRRRPARPRAAGAGRQPPGPRTAGERRVALRRQLNALVAAHHHRTGLPHGKIHAELRRLCGGPPSAQATIEQLEERIATVQTL